MSQKKTIAILNGPNLNLLGNREQEIYGHQTLDEIEVVCKKHASETGYSLDFRQTNSEGELVDWIQGLSGIGTIIINPAAYTHTSIAIRDALISCDCPVIEVHISNISKREVFRHKSLISDIVTGTICGFGAYGYILAINAADDLLRNGKFVDG